MPIFGITASSNQFARLGDFSQIATTTLGSAQSTITFSNISQEYTHLQIRGIARGTSAETDVNIYSRFNSDTGNNYSYHYMFGNGSSASAGATASAPEIITGRVTAGNSGSNMFGFFVFDILDYTNTNKFKTVRSLTGHDQNGSGSAWMFSGNWRSTSAITSINFYLSPGNFATNSSFQLYGVKA